MFRLTDYRIASLVVVAFAASIPVFAQQVDANSVSGSEEIQTSETETATRIAMSQTREGLAEAAMSPLEDLNLRRDRIPELLRTMGTPYGEVHASTCGDLGELVSELNAVLSPDWDELSVAEDQEKSDGEMAGEAASDAVLGAVASEARGLIPFRSVVRRATGATAHERAVQKAFQIGHQRRAFLKGLGAAKGCTFPAAPLTTDHADPPAKIVFKGTRPH